MVEIQTRQRVDGRGLALFEFDLWMRIICKTKYHHHLQSGFNLGHLYSERELMKIDVSPFLKFLWHLDQYSSLQATWACQNKLRNGQHILKRSIIKNPFLCIPKHIYEEKKVLFFDFPSISNGALLIVCFFLEWLMALSRVPHLIFHSEMLHGFLFELKFDLGSGGDQKDWVVQRL